MGSEPVIRTRSLGKKYRVYDRPTERLHDAWRRLARAVGLRVGKERGRDFWALRNVTFDVYPGEAVAIIGRNGSGKSTLLQLICGILQPSEGSVSTSGRVTGLLELGSGFNSEFTGRENVYLNGAILGFSREEIDACFHEIVAFADIGDFLDQPVKTYSSGMLVRLAFAVQTQLNPDLLVVDEALAVGDALFQKRCYQRIEALRERGVTLLFVSHDIEIVRMLTERAVLLHRGEVVDIGPSAQVIRSYRKLLLQEEEEKLGAALGQRGRGVQGAFQERGESVVGQDANAGETDGGVSPDSVPRAAEPGDKGASILSVRVLDAEGHERRVFTSGEEIRVLVRCRVEVETDRLNVALRIRNKEGVKIYSWGTLNQDMRRMRGEPGPIFWTRRIKAGEIVELCFRFVATLGSNVYEIQPHVTLEPTPDYVHQRILHWVDEAAFFQIVVDREANFFGGSVDLRMAAEWQ